MPLKQEKLLAHADFVRVLARSLIIDENLADDVAQNTFVAALERPPKATEALGTWLGTVTRNFAYALRRESKRREARERRVARKGDVPTPAEVLEREGIRQKVVDAVLALDESYRDPILLRYYESLPPREIAERLDLPVETVRTRLKRGLARMRERLDREFGGDRKSWGLALAPLIGLRPKDLSAATAAASTPLLAGLFALNYKLKLGAAAALLLGIAALIWRFSMPDDSREPFGDTGKSFVDARDHSFRDQALLNDSFSREAANERTAASRDEEGMDAVEPTGLFLAGRVTDMKTKEPVTFYDIQVARMDLNAQDRVYNLEEAAVKETVLDEGGRFSLPLERAGTFQVVIYSPDHQVFNTYCLEVPSNRGLKGLHFALDPGRGLSGRIVEEGTGKPVAGVLVGPPADKMTRKLFTKRCLFGQPPMGIHAISDEDGRFCLTGLEPGRQKIVARHPDFVEAILEAEPGSGDAMIRLKKGYRVFGKAYPGGERMTVWVAGRPFLTDEDGCYLSAPVPPGRVKVTVESDTGPENTIGVYDLDQDYFKEEKAARISDRDLEVDFGVSDDAVIWRGEIFQGGAPVKGGRLTLCEVQSKGLSERGLLKCSSLCDQSGRFEMNRLRKGEYRVSLRIPDPYRVVKLGCVRLEESGLLEKELHIRGGVISGNALDETTGLPVTGGRIELMLMTPDEGPGCNIWWSHLDGKGRFILEGLPLGRYELCGAGLDIVEVESLAQGKLKKGRYSFELSEDAVLEHVRIKTSSSRGFIHLTMGGFGDDDSRKILPSFMMEEGGAFTDRRRTWELRSDGTLERFFKTPPVPGGSAKCVMELSAGSLIARQTFEVLPGRVAALDLSREDFHPSDRLVRVSGRLLRSDGSPVAGVRLHFSQEEVAWKNSAGFRGLTGSDGRFSLDGLLAPGKVRVELLMEGGRFRFSHVIPENPDDPCSLDLVIPGGAGLSGTLYDAVSGEPCRYKSHIHAGVSLVLRGRDGAEWETRLTRIVDGRFTMEDVPAGKYDFSVHVEGYLRRDLGPLDLSEGREMSLGDILLEPAAVLELEVVDMQGRSVGEPEVVFITKDAHGSGLRFELPGGLARFKVKVEGYEGKECTVSLEAGKTLKRKIVMSSL